MPKTEFEKYEVIRGWSPPFRVWLMKLKVERMGQRLANPPVLKLGLARVHHVSPDAGGALVRNLGFNHIARLHSGKVELLGPILRHCLRDTSW